MIPTLAVDTREFNQAMNELRRATGMEDSKVIFNTTKFLVRTFVARTRLFRKIKREEWEWTEPFIEASAKGRARLGWWPAWKHLGLPGAPQIGNGPLKDRREGGITDRSKRTRDPHITVWNEVPYIEALNKNGKILQRSVDRQLKFLVKAIDRAYESVFRRKSGR